MEDVKPVTRRIVYHSGNGKKIIPVYREGRPTGFKIVEIATGKILKTVKMLYDAENLVNRKW